MIKLWRSLIGASSHRADRRQHTLHRGLSDQCVSCRSLFSQIEHAESELDCLSDVIWWLSASIEFRSPFKPVNTLSRGQNHVASFLTEWKSTFIAFIIEIRLGGLTEYLIWYLAHKFLHRPIYDFKISYEFLRLIMKLGWKNPHTCFFIVLFFKDNI